MLISMDEMLTEDFEALPLLLVGAFPGAMVGGAHQKQL